MRKDRTLLAAVAFGLGLAATAAWGGESLGKIQTVDRDQKVVVLEDGTRLWLMPGMSFDLFIQGQRVKVVYDERDGKKWVRSVEAVN